VSKDIDRLLWLGAAMLGAACAFALWHAAAMIPLRLPLDPNEGWNAYHALAAMHGGALYPGPGSGMVNNYPPLSFYAVALVAKFTGDAIVAGRILSLASLLFVIAAIAIGARRLGASKPAALFAALWFLAGLLAFSDYVAMDDPQMLGHAIDLAGLLLLLNRQTIAAALAMTIALFVKQNLVALPLAALLWLILFEREAALRFAIAGLASGVAGLVLFREVYGQGIFGVIASPRTFSLALLARNAATWTIWSGPAMAAAIALLLAGRADRNTAFCALYALIGIAIGTSFSAGAGVDLNVWFDAAIALSLIGALALTRFHNPIQKGLALAAYLLPLLSGLALSYDESWRDRDTWLHPGADAAEIAQADIDFLKAHRGPALCEMLSLCYWAAKPAEVDTFNLGQAFATGARSDRALAARIEAGDFAALQFDSLDDFALGPRVKAAVLKRYRIDHENDDGVFLVPR